MMENRRGVVHLTMMHDSSLRKQLSIHTKIFCSRFRNSLLCAVFVLRFRVQSCVQPHVQPLAAAVIIASLIRAGAGASGKACVCRQSLTADRRRTLRSRDSSTVSVVSHPIFAILLALLFYF
jgi:hypothetical protein